MVNITEMIGSCFLVSWRSPKRTECFALRGLTQTADEANAIMLQNPHVSLADTNVLGCWIAATKPVVCSGYPFERWRGPNRLPFQNAWHLACISMGRIFQVVEICDGLTPADAVRHHKDLLVLISNLPGGHGIYGEQYCGRPYDINFVNDLYHNGLPTGDTNGQNSLLPA